MRPGLLIGPGWSTGIPARIGGMPSGAGSAGALAGMVVQVSGSSVELVLRYEE